MPSLRPSFRFRFVIAISYTSPLVEFFVDGLNRLNRAEPIAIDRIDLIRYMITIVSLR